MKTRGMQIAIVIVALVIVVGFGTALRNKHVAPVQAPIVTTSSNDGSSSQSKNDAEPGTFHGFACESDCLGHERGYEWAEERGIDDPHTCYSGARLSNPIYQSFSEGCEAYVDENTGDVPLDMSERYGDGGDSPDNSQ